MPDPVDRAVEPRTARQVIHRAIELTRREIAMPAPPIQQRIVRRDLEAARERLDRLPILAHARLRDAQRDDPADVARTGGHRARGAYNRPGRAPRTGVA